MAETHKRADSKKQPKEVKRKQISLNPEPAFMNPRLTRKYSYTDAHNSRQSDKSNLNHEFAVFIQIGFLI